MLAVVKRLHFDFGRFKLQHQKAMISVNTPDMIWGLGFPAQSVPPEPLPLQDTCLQVF